MPRQNDKKEAYKQKFEAQLHEWQAEIDKLKAKAEIAEAEARLEYLKQIDKVKALQDEGWENFEKLRNASERAWDEMKAEAELNWVKMNNAIKAAYDKLK